MGLDIAVHAGPLKQVAERRTALSDEQMDALYDQGGVLTVYNDPTFAGREAPLTDGVMLSGPSSSGFRAGSYSGYNRYRENLCHLALGVLPSAVWADPEAFVGRPFVVQIHFSDCEGTIGADVAAVLAKDYADRREQAREALDEYDFATFERFREGFEKVAATGGALVFA